MRRSGRNWSSVSSPAIRRVHLPPKLRDALVDEPLVEFIVAIHGCFLCCLALAASRLTSR